MELFAPVHIGEIELEFFLFALTLVGVAVFHHKTMSVALVGLAAIPLFPHKAIFEDASPNQSQAQ
ncbi:MAG: hypothetical protein IPP77_08635 [Bacteroidetes bacterium]|nr:hypothetical protein [Bacteroidota bacterium]